MSQTVLGQHREIREVHCRQLSLIQRIVCADEYGVLSNRMAWNRWDGRLSETPIRQRSKKTALRIHFIITAAMASRVVSSMVWPIGDLWPLKRLWKANVRKKPLRSSSALNLLMGLLSYLYRPADPLPGSDRH